MTDHTATSITKLLQQHRLYYRSFGPYWWPVKTLLRAAGFAESLGLGPPSRDEVAARAWFKGLSLSEVIGAALDYHQSQVTRGTPLETEHTTPDGDEQYVIHDEDME